MHIKIYIHSARFWETEAKGKRCCLNNKHLFHEGMFCVCNLVRRTVMTTKMENSQTVRHCHQKQVSSDWLWACVCLSYMSNLKNHEHNKQVAWCVLLFFKLLHVPTLIPWCLKVTCTAHTKMCQKECEWKPSIHVEWCFDPSLGSAVGISLCSNKSPRSMIGNINY